jgi:hypothetical protein
MSDIDPDMCGISEAIWDIRQLGFIELAWHEFSNVFILIRVIEEVLAVAFDRLIHASWRGFAQPRDRLHFFDSYCKNPSNLT